MAGGHQLAVLSRQGQDDKILDFIPQPLNLSPAARHQQGVAKIEGLILQLRRQFLAAMADRQYVEVIAGRELDLAQGLPDQLRLGRQHNFGDTNLLQRFVPLPLIQSRQRDQVISRGQLLRLFFAADHINSVIGLEHGLRHCWQKLCSAMRMFLEADEDGAKPVEQLHLRN